MAFLDIENGQKQDLGYHIRTYVMTGFVAIATWDLAIRHVYPMITGHELALASLLQDTFQLEHRLWGEALYFAVIAPLLPLLYFGFWRPLIQFLNPRLHWSVFGSTFGIFLYVTLNMVLMTLAETTAHHSGSYSLLFGTMTCGLATAGFEKLRTFGYQVICKVCNDL